MASASRNVAGCEKGVSTRLPFVSSRYNFAVPVSDGSLLYNANSGAVLMLRGGDASRFAQTLSSGVVDSFDESLPEGLWSDLIDGKFMVESGSDELAEIRSRFARARGETPLVLTLTTTMECNLGCFYCYENRTSDRLTLSDIPTIVEATREKIRSHPRKSLHVDWYGGEPLLNVEFIEAASPALQEMCRLEGAAFHASVISNGTVWPADVPEFVDRHAIRQVQVSFDGLRDNHERRRRFRNGYRNGDESSFELLVALVDRLLDSVRVDLRFNADVFNQHELLPFVDFCRARGWFAKAFPAVVQPARLASYSERSAFMRDKEMTLETYDSLRAAVRAAAHDVYVQEAEVPDGFPYPKTSVCAALASRSNVIGADGLIYRCGLQVGERIRAVGSIRAGTEGKFSDSEWWDNFDPTVMPNCARCSFLPICWGGCPKKHLEGDQHALDEQSVYWRTNLPRLVASRFHLEPAPGFAFTEADQFR
jgi:uncharacterized protein